MTFTTTLAQLLTFTRDILAEASGSGVYTDSFLTSVLNNEQKRIFREHRWSFSEKSALYTAYADLTLQEAITTASTEIKVEASCGWPTSGYLFISGNPIKYTGLTVGTSYDLLTGVTGITLNTAAGFKVKRLYELPSDFSQYLSILVNNFRISFMNYQSFKKEYYYLISMGVDNPVFTYPRATYTLVNTDGKLFVLFADSYRNSERIEMQYSVSPSTMTSSVNCALPDEFAEKVLCPMAAAKAIMYRGDVNGLANGIYSMGQEELIKFVQAFDKETESFMDKIQTAAQKRVTKV